MTAKSFNFTKPVPLAPDVKQRMRSWFHAACTLAPQKWGKHFPFGVELEFQDLDFFRTGEALAQLPDNAVAYRVALGNEAVDTMLAFPRPVVLALVSGLVGDAPVELPPDRELTAVEKSLLEYLIQNLVLNVFQETWQGVEPIPLVLGAREPNPKWSRLFSPDNNLVLCKFSLKTGFGQHEWYWLIEQKPLHSQFNDADQPPELPPDQKDVQARLEGLVHHIPVVLSVVLGTVEVPLASLSQLRVGDLVILNQRVTNPLSVLVAGRKKFQGWPGRIGSQQALQIDHPTD